MMYHSVQADAGRITAENKSLIKHSSFFHVSNLYLRLALISLARVTWPVFQCLSW